MDLLEVDLLSGLTHGPSRSGLTHGPFASPIQEEQSEKGACPNGWLHYERFCVTKGVGSSDRTVALYCDSFGGIGVKGLCIIRAHDVTTTEQKSTDTNSESPGRTDSHVPLLLHWSLLGDKQRDDGDEIPTDEDSKLRQSFLHIGASLSTEQDFDLDTEDTGVCPKGWTHYGTLCVYKPWSVQERCRSMNALEFNGLCLKHADTSAVAKYKDGNILQEVKRVCCCASVRGRPNGYGC
ncbi:hypothetical protein Btru_020820 [Bulinus truncatus]|nr:hypothetical protein Btru_020820 [Bulinus truncatus]